MDDNDFLESASSKAQRARLAQISMANPTTSHHCTHGIGGVDLDDEIWDVRIHFDAWDNLERKLCSSDVTYLNLVVLVGTQGYSICDSMYYIKTPGIGVQGLELIDTNAKVQQIKEQNEESMVLNLSAMRGRSAKICTPVSVEHNTQLQPIVYEEPVVYDLIEPPAYAIDQQGNVFKSQCSSRSLCLHTREHDC